MTLDTSRLISGSWIDSVEHHLELGSTQDRARVASAELPVERSLIVVADRQTSGRGRGSNRWWTGEGSLAFSIVFDPARFDLVRRAVPQVSLTAAVALIDALVPWIGEHAIGLHWPNDIYVSGRKLAGILVDVLPDGRNIVGVGVNTNNSLGDVPAELRESVATIHWLTGRLVDHAELLAVFLDQFAVALRQLAGSPLQFGGRFDALCLQHGELLTVRNGDERTTGRCAGVAPDGALLLDCDQGRRSFYSGTLR